MLMINLRRFSVMLIRACFVYQVSEYSLILTHTIHNIHAYGHANSSHISLTFTKSSHCVPWMLQSYLCYYDVNYHTVILHFVLCIKLAVQCAVCTLHCTALHYTQVCLFLEYGSHRVFVMCNAFCKSDCELIKFSVHNDDVSACRTSIWFVCLFVCKLFDFEICIYEIWRNAFVLRPNILRATFKSLRIQ